MVFDCFLLSINVQSANWMIGTGQGASESRDPKFTWEGVESIRFFRLACQVRVLFLSQTWLMIWLDMSPLSSCRFACGFEHALWLFNVAIGNHHF